MWTGYHRQSAKLRFRLGQMALLKALVALLLVAVFLAPQAAEAHGDHTKPGNLTAEAPRNLTGAFVEGEGVVLHWEPPSATAALVTGYQVLRRRPMHGETRLLVYVEDTESTVTTYTDVGATTPGEQYNYQVKALRSGQASGHSNLLNVPIGPTVTRDQIPRRRHIQTGSPGIYVDDTGRAEPSLLDMLANSVTTYVDRIKALIKNGLSRPSQNVVASTSEQFTCGSKGLDKAADIDEVDSRDGQLLPDLVSCAPNYSLAEVVVAPDGTELHALRFGGYVTNLGDGPLDLKGNPRLADDAVLTSHNVWQRALTVDGDWVNLTKPPIKFERADGHDHFHVMGIVEYSLWDKSGTMEVRSGAKVGFCLVDSVELPDLHPNPGPERYSRSANLWCRAGRPGAKDLHMGISEGWQDVYSWAAPFQWIDVSDVRPGYYRVGQRTDPDNIIIESDETNNGLALSRRLHVVPGYVARPETVRVEPDATVRFKLSADEYFEAGSPRTRAYRIVTQPAHGSLDVGGSTDQMFTDEWVTYTPDPGYVGVDSFRFVAVEQSRPQYPINPVIAKLTLDISGLNATVTIDNAPASIATGSSFDLDATVNGATDDVTWSVDGVEGGSDEAGIIDADGRYSAPVVPPMSGTVTVRAVSTQVPRGVCES